MKLELELTAGTEAEREALAAAITGGDDDLVLAVERLICERLGTDDVEVELGTELYYDHQTRAR